MVGHNIFNHKVPQRITQSRTKDNASSHKGKNISNKSFNTVLHHFLPTFVLCLLSFVLFSLFFIVVFMMIPMIIAPVSAVTIIIPVPLVKSVAVTQTVTVIP